MYEEEEIFFASRGYGGDSDLLFVDNE